LSYYTIAKGLTAKAPATPLSLAQEVVQDAIGKIYDQTDWSFQRSTTYANWLCPGNIANVGTADVTPYSPTVTLDATASNALAMGLAASGVFATTLQFRSPSYSIYNIIGYDTTVPTAAVLTLDRPWLEPITGPMYYMIYQVYFVAPVQDFRKFIEVRDTTNAARLDFWSMTEAELAIRDPQRTEFADPSFVVPAGIDQRPGSSTFGYPMFELWPQQLSYLPYSFSYRRRGAVPQTFADFQNSSPPYPITEELVKWRSLEVLYQFKEAQREKTAARGAGANWLMLAQYAEKQYAGIYSEILSIDMNINGENFTKIEGRGRLPSNRPYSNQLGGLNIGGFPER
jgi:hypothetical protein